MIRFENTITINRSLKDVFSFVSDQCNNSMWNYYVLEVRKLNEREGAGAEYLQIRKSDQQRFQIIEFAMNERCTVQTLRGERPSVRRQLEFSGNEEQTQITDHVDLRLPVPRFLSGWLGRAPKKAVKENLERLKILLESGQVVLQDGRKVQLGDGLSSAF